jgi:hypothetical protein
MSFRGVLHRGDELDDLRRPARWRHQRCEKRYDHCQWLARTRLWTIKLHELADETRLWFPPSTWLEEFLASTAVTHPATAPRIAAIKAGLVELWPSSIIVLGVTLTVVRNGALFWLLMRLLSLFWTAKFADHVL